MPVVKGKRARSARRVETACQPIKSTEPAEDGPVFWIDWTNKSIVPIPVEGGQPDGIEFFGIDEAEAITGHSRGVLERGRCNVLAEGLGLPSYKPTSFPAGVCDLLKRVIALRVARFELELKADVLLADVREQLGGRR